MKELAAKVSARKVQKISKDLVWQFGDSHDGTIEFVGIIQGGYIETGYFYGDDKSKNILVISSQIGCPSRCSFCNAGNQPFVRNLSAQEIYEQVVLILQQASQYGFDLDSIEHKVNYAKSGDPLFNPEFTRGIERIGEFNFSYKVSTVFPAGNQTMERFRQIADFAAAYTNNVQIQISLISTSERYRNKVADIRLASFADIKRAAEYWRDKNPNGRKINFSLILTEEDPVNVDEVYNIFPPELFRFRFRNYMPTEHGTSQGLETITRERFERIMDRFRKKGYEVGTWATPTPMEKRFRLASNVTLARYRKIISGQI